MWTLGLKEEQRLLALSLIECPRLMKKKQTMKCFLITLNDDLNLMIVNIVTFCVQVSEMWSLKRKSYHLEVNRCRNLSELNGFVRVHDIRLVYDHF